MFIVCVTHYLQIHVAVDPSFEVDAQLRQRQVPVLHRMRPLFGCLQHTCVQQLEQRVFMGEATFGLGQFTELAMHRLNRIGRVNRFAHLFRVLEVNGEILPLTPPGLDHQRVLRAPFRFQLVQRLFGGILSRGAVNALQI